LAARWIRFSFATAAKFLAATAAVIAAVIIHIAYKEKYPYTNVYT